MSIALPIGTFDAKLVEDLRGGISANPADDASRERLAVYLLDHGHAGEALRHLQVLLERRGDSDALCTLIAYALMDDGHTVDAQRNFAKALRFNPENEEAELGSIALCADTCSQLDRHYGVELGLKLADDALHQGEALRAKRVLENALRVDPANADARYWLAVTLADLGESHLAVSMLTQLAKEEPEDGRALLALGSAYQSVDDRKSIDCLRDGVLREFPFLEALFSTPLEEHSVPIEPLKTIELAGNLYPKIAFANTQRRPFWSVVVPVYGRRAYIAECLASVLRQYPGGEEMEIIVLDNGSEPALGALIEQLAGNTIRYYRRNKPLPLQHNWNSALGLCSGQWIHMLHDDDLVLSGFYERLAAGIEAGGEQLGVASCGYELVDEHNRVLGRSHLRSGFRGVAENWIDDIGVANVINPPCPVIRREAFEKLGGYRTDFTYTIDWEMYMRLACHYDWWLEPEHLARYRIHAFNVSAEQNLAGIQGRAFAKAIELSEAYLPAVQRSAISQRARANSAAWCLERASIPDAAGNHAGTLRIVQDSLRLNPSDEWSMVVAEWFTGPARKNLREAVAPYLAGESAALANLLQSKSDFVNALKNDVHRAAFLSVTIKGDETTKLFFSDEATS